MGTEFVAGAYWTPDRAAQAVARMSATLASPEFQAVMQQIADGAAEGGDPAAVAAAFTEASSVQIATAAPIEAEACNYRRGRPSDAPRFAQIIAAAELPPLFIEEFVEGFVAVEHDGDVIACGGMELYGDCGVIRSVAVDASARKLGVGERIAALLMQDARAAGVVDVYLFTQHAANFWRRLGYVDAPIETWRPEPRISWQYQFISRFPEVARDVIPMWQPAKSS